MSEKILRAILQLLAASAQVDGLDDKETEIIKKFLSENFNDELVGKYLALFHTYSSQQLDVEAICKNLNEELTSTQKLVVISNLLETSIADGLASEGEQALVAYISRLFNFNTEAYEEIKTFILNDFKQVYSQNNVVSIGANPFFDKHIYRDKLDGVIGILRIPSLEKYLFKYVGKNDIDLNGIAVKNGRVYNFPVGSSIHSEKMDTVYYSDVVSLFLNEHHADSISFEAEDIWYYFPNHKLGLRSISLAEDSGKLVGLMGASGSGKSTLLNVLNGNLTPSKGSVKINGVNIHQENEKITGIIGYVPQDDLLIEELTVYQNLYYAAKLSFSHYTENQIDELVQKTLSNLGLFEIQDLKVGNPLQKTISGGQRKRVNIGLELLREPAVLFVDEPTSGLSSRDSENIMDLFKELSLKGKLIFVVIHQPSSDIFKMFDKLLILDVGGYPIYYGNPIEAINYFKSIAGYVDKDQNVCHECGNVNPEQIFNIIEAKTVNEYGTFTKERKVTPRKWNEYFEKLINPPKNQLNATALKSNLRIPKRLQQAQLFFMRDVLSKLSNTQYMVINLLEAPLLAIILAYIVRFYQSNSSEYVFSKNNNIPAYIFMSVIVALFIGLSVSAEEIIKDAKILKREAFLHLSRGSYLSAKIMLLFMFSAVQTLSFVVIGNWILGIEEMNFLYWLVLFSVSCFANLLGLNISSSFNSVVTIYILIPLLLIPQLLLGGIVVRFNEINPSLSSEKKVPLLAEIMASRWAFEALVVAQFKQNPYQKGFFEFDRAMAQAEYHKSLYIPELETLLDDCLNAHKVDSLQKELKKDFSILKNEILIQSKYVGISFTLSQKLNKESFDMQTYKQTKDYLQQIKKYYIKLYNENTQNKDKLIGELTKTEAQKELFLNTKSKFHNEAIEKLVTAKETPEHFVRTSENIIQKVYPVFNYPAAQHSLDFRTHFFAPKKHFLGMFYETVYFNVCIIWGMGIFLYISLYFNLLKKFLDMFGNLIGRMKNKKNKE
ncbi:MAG: ATP-binding cassette domain-containing protein [Thermonemataceae bacterium]|nr:ATP-binding cassette domain-containing protein [Thermonemataceae bacterium]